MSPKLSAFAVRLLPFLRWFPMSRATLRADLIAGITVGLVLVPQSMAYAQLAGLPAYFGLYAAFLPVLIGAAWGSSHQLATGPVAMVSILTASTLVPLASPGSEQFIALAIGLALIAGIMQIALGLFRLGAIVSFLSHPVIVGFTNAAAIIIALSQLNKLLGVSIGRSEHFLNDVLGVLQQIDDTHWPTLAMGIGAIALILVLRRVAPRLPGVLITASLAILLSWGLQFERSAQLPIDSLASPDARALADEHRNGAAEIARLNRSVESRLAELKALRTPSIPNDRHRLTLEYQIQTMRLEIRALESENRLRVRALRQFHLQQVKMGDAGTRLYAVGQLPPGAEIDARRWRIQRVGDDTLLLVGGGEVVGRIPEGLPELRMPRFSMDVIAVLFSSALVITLVGFMEAVSVAKAMATKTRQRIDPNQELIGQGLANIVGSFSQSYPVSGSFSRSAVNISAGAITGLSSVFSALIVLVTLLFLTPLLYHLPQAVLAAIIMVAVFGLIDLRAFKHAWAAHRHDGICAVVTFTATLGFAPHLDVGILLGGGLAIIMFLYRTMSPRVRVRFHESSQSAAPAAESGQGVVAIRFNGRLYFANVPYFEDAVLDAASRHPHAKAILVVGDGMNEIDASGEEVLRHLHRRLRDSGVTMVFADLIPQVTNVMRATGLYAEIGAQAFYGSERDALRELLGTGDRHPVDAPDDSTGT
jgi:SulP family sulfate permease